MMTRIRPMNRKVNKKHFLWRGAMIVFIVRPLLFSCISMSLCWSLGKVMEELFMLSMLFMLDVNSSVLISSSLLVLVVVPIVVFIFIWDSNLSFSSCANSLKEIFLSLLLLLDMIFRIFTLAWSRQTGV